MFFFDDFLQDFMRLLTNNDFDSLLIWNYSLFIHLQLKLFDYLNWFKNYDLCNPKLQMTPLCVAFNQIVAG